MAAPSPIRRPAPPAPSRRSPSPTSPRRKSRTSPPPSRSTTSVPIADPNQLPDLQWSLDARILLALRERLLADNALRMAFVQEDQIAILEMASPLRTATLHAPPRRPRPARPARAPAGRQRSAYGLRPGRPDRHPRNGLPPPHRDHPGRPLPRPFGPGRRRARNHLRLRSDLHHGRPARPRDRPARPRGSHRGPTALAHRRPAPDS